MVYKALLYAIIATTLAGGGAVMAQSEGLLKINPVPSLESRSQEGVKGVAFIDEVDGMGIIRRVEERYIVIEDMGYNLANDVKYFGADGYETFHSNFREGRPAAFVLNASHEIESLWEVKEIE
ncbi:MAG: hypothetical protein JJV98_09565 [Desulfosarcina sp.]|nr:hypothetical protein [Desulfobacterales bacterium]